MDNNIWPSDEALELAAVSAETWHEHGRRRCACLLYTSDAADE